MSGDRGGLDGARDLLVRYLSQLKELGESEIYLSPEARDDVMRPSSRTAPAPSRPAAAKRAAAAPEPPKPAAAGLAAGAPKPSASALAAEIPEPEVVQAKLAVTRGAGTNDMFTESTELDGCSKLEDVEAIATSCGKCELSQGRTKVVFGVGNPGARLMFIGEAPGRDEDLSGVPFVGRAGQLLDKVLAAAEIARDDVYIGNIIKCRPPNNRTPLTSEIDACMPYLAKQIAYIRPSIICTLGLPATHTLLGVRGSMGSLRGKIYKAGDIVVVPTYHPAAALRDPRYKKPIWEDFLIVKREYDRAGGSA
ncbi:MAG: uracil-DNA glycosylase [Candidatus Eisenbacteria bacterium]